MSAATKIEWCDSTFNPWVGCTRVSPACDDCYAARSTPARTQGVEWGAGQPRKRTSAANWKLAERWNAKPFRACASCGWRGDGQVEIDGTPACPNCRGSVPVLARRRVFCASLADWLDNEVPIEWLVDLLDLIRRTPNLDWLLLTKRIGNWRSALDRVLGAGYDGCGTDEKSQGDRYSLRVWTAEWLNGMPPANVWIGATVVNQAEADRDVPKLLAVPATIRFLSMEPLLGPVDLRWFMRKNVWKDGVPVRGGDYGHGTKLDWGIVGGESGPQARPMHPGWVRSLRDQCQAAGVPFLFKQWGEWAPAPSPQSIPTCDGRKAAPDVAFVTGKSRRDHIEDWAEMNRIGKSAAGRLLDGRTWDEFPKVGA